MYDQGGSLEHHGIKGMHWGRKKSNIQSKNKSQPHKAKKIIEDFLKEFGDEPVDDMFVTRVRYRALKKRGKHDEARKLLAKTVVRKALE